MGSSNLSQGLIFLYEITSTQLHRGTARLMYDEMVSCKTGPAEYSRCPTLVRPAEDWN